MSKVSGAIIAKAKAMHGASLKEADYLELVRKHSVAEVVSYLKNETNYRDILKDVRENNIHRGQLEVLLREELFQRQLALYRYADASLKDVFHVQLEEVEIELILNCVRMLISDSFAEGIADLPFFLKDYLNFSLVDLGKVRSYEELLALLAKTHYASILMKHRCQRGEELKLNYAHIEHDLMQLYYERMLASIQRQKSKKVRKQLQELATALLDFDNLTKIYRLKKYFHLSDDLVRSSLMEVQGYHSKVPLEEMIACSDEQAMRKWLHTCKYHVELQEHDYIEQGFEKIRYKEAGKLFQYSLDAYTVYSSYHLMMRQELENLIHIIEGIRYQVPCEEIEKQLIY
ncbi:putative ATP synthase subunit C [Amedibacillus dolichus CAG:375]|uniref:Putative ATP synthase subunit C n=1 Tax=Amedibacillus dolichus CAG:375 TaxID=1263076 RepID=R7G4Y3_9FIRM|nr:V-type ATPase subunit [Amedibacillus dolichus]CDE21768.1 putative ATP synthase subunit C [Amedibacillus dolichus CAG:375]